MFDLFKKKEDKNQGKVAGSVAQHLNEVAYKKAEILIEEVTLRGDAFIVNDDYIEFKIAERCKSDKDLWEISTCEMYGLNMTEEGAEEGAYTLETNKLMEKKNKPQLVPFMEMLNLLSSADYFAAEYMSIIKERVELIDLEFSDGATRVENEKLLKDCKKNGVKTFVCSGKTTIPMEYSLSKYFRPIAYREGVLFDKFGKPYPVENKRIVHDGSFKMSEIKKYHDFTKK